VKRRRAAGWQRRENGQLRRTTVSPIRESVPRMVCRRNGGGLRACTEYREHGVDWLRFAENDRVAGYSRLLELIHAVPERIAPRWAQVPAHAGGSPRLFIFCNCVHVVEQLKSAPVAAEGPDAGKAVDANWEHEHGHAHAALRYGAMSRPSPSAEPVQDDDYCSHRMRQLIEANEKGERPSPVHRQLTSGTSGAALLEKSALQPRLWAASERLSRTRVLRAGAGGRALSRARVEESDASVVPADMRD
jgi:hypothetical protein